MNAIGIGKASAFGTADQSERKSIFIGNSKLQELFSGKKQNESAVQLQREVALREASLASLKEDESISMEQKLEMFHQIQDEIKAVKYAYNLKRVSETVEEMQEEAEELAKAAEKLEQKTPEERAEECLEEALGIEEEGILDEFMDELEETIEMTEDIESEFLNESLKELKQKTDIEKQKELEEELLKQGIDIKEDTEKRIFYENLNYKRFDYKA